MFTTALNARIIIIFAEKNVRQQIAIRRMFIETNKLITVRA